jgi:hypothetical protein
MFVLFEMLSALSFLRRTYVNLFPITAEVDTDTEHPSALVDMRHHKRCSLP